MKRTLVISLLVTCLSLPALAGAPVKRTLCVFDPSGAVGDGFNMMKEYRNAALAWGVELELKPYTDEKTATEDLKAGKCHAALLTGVRARAFNKFAATVEALGAVRSYEQLKAIVQLLADPKAATHLKENGYEAVGIFPAGAVYLFVRDRAWNGMAQLVGKRIATLDFDQAAITMVDRAGASMVSADIGTFAGMFNNGNVDAAYAPATAFRPLELQKGIGQKGGILRYPMAQLTVQLVLRVDSQFPEGFGEKSRAYAGQNLDNFLKLVQRNEKDIPAKNWIDVPPPEAQKTDEIFRNVRIALRDKGTYDTTMLTLLRRVRCKHEPSQAECAQKLE